MITFKKNVNLRPYTSLKIGAPAAYFGILQEPADIFTTITFARQQKLPIMILGGGTNLLITRPLKAVVVKNEIKGLEIIKENKKQAWLAANSGEWWTAVVNFAVNHQLYGLENLFLVPGTVGAAPVQNIGAYGVELKDSFAYLEAINLRTGRLKKFDLAACQFAYRHSIFKAAAKGRWFISRVVLKLDKQAELNLDYGDIRAKLVERGIAKPSLKQVVSIIEEIRNSKLPNPAVLPNAGSFFKNPEIKLAQLKKLQSKYPELKYFPGKNKNYFKVPAGWLIEQAGFKGKRFGPVGMYDKQALILVNYGGASARQALNHIKRIQTKVEKKFGIKLEPEVNII